MDGYDLALAPHIVGGTVAILAGAAALSLRKGGRGHGRAGTLFAAAMLLMLATGMLLATLRSDFFVAAGAIFATYLVATGWATARGRGEAGRFERAAMVAALVLAGLAFLVGVEALAQPRAVLRGAPAAGYFAFAGLATLAAALDLNFILRRRLPRARMVARHLWRMCAAFFMATGSLFLGQQQAFPEAWRGSLVLFVPALAPLAAMLFWLVRVRVSRAWRAAACRPAPGAAKQAAMQGETS